MIKTESGDTVYENEIETLFLEYCELHNIDLENDSIKPSKGNAIWKYIYNILFRPDKNTVRYNNKNSKLDYGNIDLLNDVADIYIDLCFDYGIPQSRYGFSRLTGISEDELLRWNKEESRGGSDGATSSHCVLVKKIDSARRAFVRDKLMENPVGQMAIANNDKETGLLYAANQAQAQAEAWGIPQQSREEIAARHARYIGAKEPERPEI